MNREYTFLYKDNSEDRDCVNYIEIDSLQNKPSAINNRYNSNGANFSGTLGQTFNSDKVNYEDIKTILTKEEYDFLCDGKYDEEINNSIIDKLISEENQKLFLEIQEEEKEYLKDEYNLDDDDIEQIFDEYYLDYKDRGIVGYIYYDKEAFAYEEAISCGFIDDNNPLSRYVDYEAFGDALLDEERYLELSDGRVVVLNY